MNDPIRPVLQSLNEIRAIEKCDSHRDQYVSLRLVDWMSGNDRYRVTYVFYLLNLI